MKKNDFIAIKSPNQFEIKIPYPAKTDAKKIRYDTNIYFFIPKILNINPNSYTSSNFYSDYTSYIRLITPRKNLGQLIKRVERLITSLEKKMYKKAHKTAFEKELKLIVSSYVSYLEYFNKTFSCENISVKRLDMFLQRVEQFHKLTQKLITTGLKQNEDIHNASLSATEFLSYATQNSLLEINTCLRENEEKYSCIINKSVDTINMVILFCKENEFPIISNDTYQNEKIIYRYSILQKYFFSVWHLYQKKKRDGGSIKELYYAIAAGISMIFTTIIVFITQKKYGNFTTSFFVALVISYMFKDRIKEAYRKYFDKKMAIKIYDYKEKIYSMDKKFIFAFIKEKMRFVEYEKLQESIQKVRLLEVPKRLAPYVEEDIIKFEKNVVIYNGNIQHKYNNTIKGIDNILQFDISSYLKRMEARKVPLYRARHNKLFGNKVYHINVIVENKTKHNTEIHRARLIVDKNGIKRVEIPKSEEKIFPEDYLAKKRAWSSFKKSGLIKKASTVEKKESYR